MHSSLLSSAQNGFASNRFERRTAQDSFVQDSFVQDDVCTAQPLATIQSALQDCRAQTLALVTDLSPKILRNQAHPDFSPAGWHLGHIAYIESLWISEHLAGLACRFPQYEKLFAADGLPKAQRQNLPELGEILDYLGEVRSHTIPLLQQANLQKDGQLWYWLIQHESQHAEIIAMVLAMHQLQAKTPVMRWKRLERLTNRPERVLIEAGEFYQGSDNPEAIDNERSPHSVWLDGYWIERTPVTCAQYRAFIEAGGYQTEKWWSPQGWQWQQSVQVESPLYWTNDPQDDCYPVCGTSWYEADAYARFAGKRLPTEAEWEKAASQLDLIGNVWEWTDSWFAPYPGFRAFPYEGYSQIYFDQAHRVLRGGSWATSQWTMRNSFRNWYHPHKREMFAGFRCAA